MNPFRVIALRTPAQLAKASPVKLPEHSGLFMRILQKEFTIDSFLDDPIYQYWGESDAIALFKRQHLKLSKQDVKRYIREYVKLGWIERREEDCEVKGEPVYRLTLNWQGQV